MGKTKEQQVSFSFKKQLRVGDEGEALFRQNYASLNPVKSEDKAIDFLINGNESVELKTDTYLMSDTPNMFIEQYSDDEKKTLGGLWRAYDDKVKYFVYFYMKDKTFFWFDTVKFYEGLMPLIKKNKYKTHRILNHGGKWRSLGHLIPRKDVLHLVEKTDTMSI